MKLFVLAGDIDTQMAVELTNFFVDCKIHNEDALLLINSETGADFPLNQVISAYQCSGVKLTAIGMGTLSNCSASIFCMADERILLPKTYFNLYPSLPYFNKTRIIDEVFRKKCANNTPWKFSEKEIQEYGITTRPSTGWEELVAEAIEKDDDTFSNHFRFVGDFTCEIATDFVLFLIRCKLHKKDAFVVITSGGGSIQQLKAILNAYAALEIRLTIVGTGIVGSCAAALFCMADERILAPKTHFLIHHSSFTNTPKSLPLPRFKAKYEELQESEEILVEGYLTKTKISRELFEEKCQNGADWILTEDEWREYDIITQDPECWIEVLAKERMT